MAGYFTAIVRAPITGIVLISEMTGSFTHLLSLSVVAIAAEIDLFEKARGLPVLGVGGTIRNIGRIHRRVVDYPLEIAHNYRMCEDEVARICHMTAKMNLEERKNLKGLSKGRTDIFVGASQAVYKVMQTIFSPELINLQALSINAGSFLNHISIP